MGKRHHPRGRPFREKHRGESSLHLQARCSVLPQRVNNKQIIRLHKSLSVLGIWNDIKETG